MIQGIKESLTDVMELAEAYATFDPTAYALIQAMTHLLPHFLYARGPRPSDIQACVKLFHAGKWEYLWNERLKSARKLREKREGRASHNRKPSDSRKNSYSQKCAKKGNLRKAHHVLTQDCLQADGADTVLALRELHPQGNLHFNKTHWLTPEQVKARWDSPEGQELLETKLSVKVFREYFQSRPALGAPCPDGWRLKEMIAPIFASGDTELQEKLRRHVMLPYMMMMIHHGRFHPRAQTERCLWLQKLSRSSHCQQHGSRARSKSRRAARACESPCYKGLVRS